MLQKYQVILKVFFELFLHVLYLQLNLNRSCINQPRATGAGGIEIRGCSALAAGW